MGRWTLSNWRQMVAMTVVVAIALYGLDYATNPRPLGTFFATGPARSTEVATHPHISMWMNHMCSDSCLETLTHELKALPWVGAPTMKRPKPIEGNGPSQKNVEYGAYVEMDVAQENLAQLDFVALNEAIHKAGLTAERIEFSGVTHLRVVASLPHMCGDTCSQGLVDGLKRVQSFRASGQFAWIDSVKVMMGDSVLGGSDAGMPMPMKKPEMGKPENGKTAPMANVGSVVVFAKYDHPVDAMELLNALDKLGYSPSSIRVIAGDEG